MRFLLNLILLFFSLNAFSQKLPEIDALNRVILNHQDSIIYAHLLPEDQNNKIRTSNESWYFWYAQHDIKETRGGYDGKLLHGQYTEYYNSKDLKRKGTFTKGLKSGEWKSWYKSGQLSEIVHYKKGLREGEYTSFKEDGTIQINQKYSKGILVVKKEKIKEPKDSSSAASKKNKRATTPDQPKEELQKEKKKKGKEPKVRVRRSIKIVPQPGKST